MNLLPGSSKFTSTTGISTAVGVSGTPFRVFSIHQTTLTTGKLVLRNGTGITGTSYIQGEGTTGNSTTVNFEGGVLFPSGCYLTTDIGVQNVLIIGTCEPK